jgi:hypothetical protein
MGVAGLTRSSIFAVGAVILAALLALTVLSAGLVPSEAASASSVDSSAATTSSPVPRWGAQMAYDPVEGYTLLFSGSAGAVTVHGIHFGDTWSYGAGGWTDITPSPCSNATCPRAEAYGGLSLYHKKQAEFLVLFGGRTGSTLMDSTWIFNGSWHNVTPTTLVPYSNSPPPLNYVSMTWDATNGYDVLYGGCSYGCDSRSPSAYETWAFEGLSDSGKAVWKNLTSSVHPPSLFGEGLTYDATDGYVLLFGGQVPGTTTYLNQTWSYTASTGWVNRTARVVTPRNTPPFVGIIPGQLEYDSAKAYVLLFGGQHFWANAHGGDKTANATLNETWTYRGGTWTNRTKEVSPHPRFGAAMAFDKTDHVMLLFGGLGGTGAAGTSPLLSDTWWFNGTWSNRTLSQ